MKTSTIFWIIGGAVVLYFLLNKSSTASASNAAPPVGLGTPQNGQLSSLETDIESIANDPSSIFS